MKHIVWHGVTLFFVLRVFTGEYNHIFEDVGREKGMEWVEKYPRIGVEVRVLIFFTASGSIIL